MMAPTFLNVGSETGCTLADLTVTGYDAPEWDAEEEEYTGGCFGEFILQFLANNGSITAKYYWVDNGEVTPGWYATAGGKAIEGDVKDVKITAGTAAWVIGKEMTLQSAGQVNKNDVAFLMNASRNTACGNCMPIDLKLADLTVSGYDAPEWDAEEEEYTGGCFGEFILQFLANNGSIEGKYYWVDNGEVAPGWYASAGGKAIEGGAANISIPAGKGMWNIGKGMTLNIPSPISDAK